MDDKTYQRLLLHTESLRYIVTDLETAIRLAQELEPSGVIETHDTAGALAGAFDKMLLHIDKVLERVVSARVRVEKLAKLCHNELEFAEAEANHARLRANHGDSASNAGVGR